MFGDLREAIAKYVEAHPALTLLDEADAKQVLAHITRRFGIAERNRRWWEGIRGTPLKHGDAGPFDRLAAIPPGPRQRAFLFVTEGDSPPWPCVAGTLSELIRLIAEQPFFEYLLASEKLSWIAFDADRRVRLFAAIPGSDDPN